MLQLHQGTDTKQLSRLLQRILRPHHVYHFSLDSVPNPTTIDPGAFVDDDHLIQRNQTQNSGIVYLSTYADSRYGGANYRGRFTRQANSQNCREIRARGAHGDQPGQCRRSLHRTKLAPLPHPGSARYGAVIYFMRVMTRGWRG